MGSGMTGGWVRPPAPALPVLRDWARQLRAFRYFRHEGGHSMLEDELVLALPPGTLGPWRRRWLRRLGAMAGQQVSLIGLPDRQRIGVTDAAGQRVNARTVRVATWMERLLGDHLAHAIDPPVAHRACVSPRTHPHVFSGRAAPRA